MTMKVRDFLSAMSGYTTADNAGKSQNKPNKLAVIDPSYSGAGNPRVTFEGESVLSSKAYAVLGSYTPVASDRVVLVPVGTTYAIVGVIKTPVSSVWTPVWSGVSGAPSVGNGTMSARFQVVGNRCFFSIFVTFGLTTSGGVGQLTFSLPIASSYPHEQDPVICKLFTPSNSANWVGSGGMGSNATNVAPYFPFSATNDELFPLQSCDATVTAGTGIPNISGQFTIQNGGNLSIDGSYWLS